jgi:Ca-activated chloride channel family protein
MRFESPWAFLLLILLPLLIWMRYFRPGRTAIRFSTIAIAARAGRSVRQRFLWAPDFLRLAALAIFVIALARPQSGLEQVREINRGIAIEMVLDRSGSMGAELEYRGGLMTRLDAVKKVFEEFVMGSSEGLEGRPNDLIGMIIFARYPDTICPLTLAHGALPEFLKSVRLVQDENEDGTAIGDALALAAARLETAEKSLKNQDGVSKAYKIKSKVIVLLSDGENNYGKRTPLEAAELAAKWGIKIYSIAIVGGETVTSIQTPFGVYKVPSMQNVDTSALKAIAEKTGGFYREADDVASLREIYKEIDSMEKSEIESVRFIDYRELFHRFVLAGLMLIILETILKTTIFRKVP